jgi:sialate O-acetylesterase
LLLSNTYGKKHITPCGPCVTKAERKGNSIILTFAHGTGLKSSDGQPLRTFEIAGDKGIFYPAEKVEILKDGKMRIRSCSVKLPSRVRYGWQPFTTANLVNSDSLPASTFEISIAE